MKFKTGDIAYFHHKSDLYYGWNLYDYQKVIITNKAFDHKGDMYYSIKTSNNEDLCWYSEDDLLSKQEIRKYKITNINGNTTF